ncbi:MAG TPA: hypothetical protein PKE25_01530 [Novosphingobium sp.]|nr:hypothetical protein [Novosphingobium sp.]
MQAIEIRRADQLVLIGRRGSFPGVMLRASDRQARDAFLRELVRDEPALSRLRADWTRVFPPLPPERSGRHDIVREVERGLRSGAVQAVALRTPRMAVSPADLQGLEGAIINAGNDQRRLLIARRGALPPEFRAFSNGAQTSAVLESLKDGDATARQIDRQASRLSPDGRQMLSGMALRRNLVWQINAGALDAAVINHAPAASAAAARRDAPRAIADMTGNERVAEALQRSYPHAVKAGGEAIRESLEAMFKPEALAVMVGVIAVVAVANLHPISGAAVDTTLVLLAWWNGGKEALDGLGKFAKATIDARNATTEPQIDAAAIAYGAALGMMGPKLLNAMFNRFVPRKSGRSGDKGAPTARAVPPRQTPAPRQAGGTAQPPATQKKAGPGPQAPKGRIPSGKTETISADEANHFHTLKGNRPPYAPGKPVKEIITDSDETFVRVHGPANQGGSWVARAEDIKGLSPQQIKDKFALPELPTHVSDVSVPAGTRIRVGEAGALPGWGNGGGLQVEVMERTSVFSNQRPLQ